MNAHDRWHSFVIMIAAILTVELAAISFFEFRSGTGWGLFVGVLVSIPAIVLFYYTMDDLFGFRVHARGSPEID